LKHYLVETWEEEKEKETIPCKKKRTTGFGAK
jgi:hypothetical protein